MPKQAEPTIGAVLVARVTEQTRVLRSLAGAVRADEPDAVHQMRIACRRLRSALQSFGGLLESDGGLPGELRWLAGELGRARDAEVLGERLLTAARALPEECGPGPVTRRLETWSRARYATAWPSVLAAMDDPRREELVAALDRLVADPPFTPRAGRAAGPELLRVLKREQRRTGRRMRAATEAEPGPEQETALHDARKAAKRARYAGETAGETAGARRYTKRMKALQDLLGVHQDAVIACEALRELARSGDGTEFAYGVLYGEQLAAAAQAREQVPDAWRRAGKPVEL